MRRSHGFTLIELAIVMVIIGITLSFGMPAFANYRNDMKLKQARAQLTQDIRMARQLAVTRRCPVYIRFGTPPATANITTYSILVDTNGNGLADAGERAMLRRLPSSTVLSSVAVTPVDTLGFDISGVMLMPRSGGSPGGTLVFHNARSRYDTLAVSTAGILFRP